MWALLSADPSGDDSNSKIVSHSATKFLSREPQS